MIGAIHHSGFRKRAHRVITGVVALLSIATVLMSASPVAALTAEERRSYALRGIEFIDDPCTPGVGSDATVIGSINGSPDAKTLNSKFHQHVIDSFFFFLKEGFTPAQSAGIVGNLMQESSENIDPMNTDGVAHGIAQWQGGRLTSMYAWVAANYGDKNSFVGQLNYIMQELKSSYTTVLSTMHTFKTPEEAANYWNLHYEISADRTDKRPKHARDVYNAATLQPPAGEGWIVATGGSIVNNVGPAGGGCNGATNAGSPDCATATGNPKILCEAQKYNGIYYSFGAGHAGYDNFKSKCPLSAVPSAASKSTPGNPGPCATDCSSLVSIALDEAFGLKKMWSVGSITAGGTGWVKINVTEAQPGDIVTAGSEHVEIVDHYNAQQRRILTFGSHETGTRTSASSAGLGYYDQAWRWSGN